ncbi:MAG: hypothetical protein V1893_00805 [Candidatus Omnitrophota bacterium]
MRRTVIFSNIRQSPVKSVVIGAVVVILLLLVFALLSIIGIVAVALVVTGGLFYLGKSAVKKLLRQKENPVPLNQHTTVDCIELKKDEFKICK